MKKEKVIEIKEDVIINQEDGTKIILEKGDKVEVLNNGASLKEADITVKINPRGTESLTDIISMIMLEAGMGRNMMDTKTKLLGSPDESINSSILYGSSIISQKFLFAGYEGILKRYSPIGIFASSKFARVWVEVNNKIIDVNIK